MAEYIDREKIRDETCDGCTYRTDRTGCACPEPCQRLISAFIETDPADVLPVVHAKWEECDYVEPCVHGFGTIRYPNTGLKCTNCVNVFNKKLLWKDSFCPNCGAKMDG